MSERLSMSNDFNQVIKNTISQIYGVNNVDIVYNMPIIQYLVKKTKSANKGSKSRGGFGNLYAIYVLVEDYIAKGYPNIGNYSKSEGAKFSFLLTRQRELPFGSKLQNHALNHRFNEEFKKFFPTIEIIPIIRDTKNNHYWFNEQLLVVNLGGKFYNIATLIIDIINKYVDAKQNAMNFFLGKCEEMKLISSTNSNEVYNFIVSLLDKNVDARLFEIVSYSILKYYYNDIKIYWGYKLNRLVEENLTLYKTGRTNANDGGIDFVMKPLGRFFQVTETIDFKKYFLDIDKVAKFPMTFVVKTDVDINTLNIEIENKAYEVYGIKKVVDTYLESIEELINIPILLDIFNHTIKIGHLNNILDEIIIQSKVEFNV